MSGLFSFLGINTPGQVISGTTLKTAGATAGVVNAIADTTREFINLMKPIEVLAQTMGFQRGILTAQIALETGYGRKVIGKNLFNIKATDSWIKSGKKTANVKTTEVIGGQSQSVISQFRDYDTFIDSARDYINLISQASRYSNAWINRGNYKKYYQELHRGGYATDPNYVAKLINTFETLGFN